MKEVYLDNNATTAVAPEVVEAMLPYWEQSFGNPSSIHKKGIEAERAVQTSRAILAHLLDIKEGEVFFTSGATESDNWALKGAARALKRRGNHILTSKIEHEAVLSTCKTLEKEGFHVSYLDIDERGRIAEEQILLSMTDKTILTAFMHVNNELGTIYPIHSFAEVVKKRKPDIIFFSDGVQAFGKVPIDLSLIDLYAISAHKIHGPKGVGALIKKEGVRLEPLLDGGGQEMSLRSGTENVPGVVGFARAAELAYEEFTQKQMHMKVLREQFIEDLSKQIPNGRINSPEDAVPSTVNIAFLGIPAEVLVRALDAEGISASTGSACSTNRRQDSYVLKALHVPDEVVRSSVRFSFSRYTTSDELHYAVEVLARVVVELRAKSPSKNPA